MRTRFASAIIGLAAAASILIPAGCRRSDPKALNLELLPAEDSPYVSVRVLLEVGSAFDPPGKEGLCRLTWSLLADGGSRTRTSGQIAAALAPFGGRWRLDVGREASAFSTTVAREDLNAFYSVLREMLLEPGLREEDFARLKSAQAGLLSEALSGGREERLAGEILSGMLGQDPAGSRAAAGSLDSVSTITLDEVRDFHREHFVRGNVTIGLAGAYPAGFPERVRRDFEGLEPAFTPRLPVSGRPRRSRGPQAVLAALPGASSAIALGWPLLLSPDDDDFHALGLAAAHLAGSDAEAAVGRLGAGLEGGEETRPPDRRPCFSLIVRASPGMGAEDLALRSIGEIRNLAEEGLTEERFTLIRDGLLGSIGLRGGSLADRLARRMDARSLGSQDSFDAAARILPGLTAEDVRDAVRRHLRPGGLHIAVVTGDAEAWPGALAAGSGLFRPRPEAVRVLAAADWIRSGETPPVDAAKPDRLE